MAFVYTTAFSRIQCTSRLIKIVIYKTRLIRKVNLPLVKEMFSFSLPYMVLTFYIALQSLVMGEGPWLADASTFIFVFADPVAQWGHTLSPLHWIIKKCTFPSLFTVESELIKYIQWPGSWSYKKQDLGLLTTMVAFASAGTDSFGEIPNLLSRMILVQPQTPSGFQLVVMSNACALFCSTLPHLEQCCCHAQGIIP